MNICDRGLRSCDGFTGTGLAHPITGIPVSAPIAGRIKEPKGSMCGIGLRVRRPARLAVSSPNQYATTPWLISCRITATTSAAKKTTVDWSMVTRQRRSGVNEASRRT